MARSNTFSQNLLKLIFNNTPLANVGDATGLPASATEGSVYIALFTTMPTASTNGTETTYAGYNRISIPRNSTNIQVGTTDPTTLKNINAVTYPASTAAAPNIVGCGVSFTSSGNCEYFGTFVNPIVVLNGTIPTIPALTMKIILT